MQSEHRLHPASFLFAIAGHLRNLLLPGLAVFFTAGASGADWDSWLAVAVIPLAAFSLKCAAFIEAALDEGFTTVRDAGGLGIASCTRSAASQPMHCVPVSDPRYTAA